MIDAGLIYLDQINDNCNDEDSDGASVLSTRGDVLLFSKDNDEALKMYNAADAKLESMAEKEFIDAIEDQSETESKPRIRL